MGFSWSVLAVTCPPPPCPGAGPPLPHRPWRGGRRRVSTCGSTAHRADPTSDCPTGHTQRQVLHVLPNTVKSA